MVFTFIEEMEEVQLLREKFDGEAGYRLLMGFLLLGVLFLRFYKLDQIPVGLHIDEAGMAYDAWCLLENGTDRWLHSWPVYLNNTGNGQSVLYCILCALSFRLFGVSTLAIRLPAAAFSLLTLFYGIKLVHLCWGNDRKRIALVTLLFVLVPYFTQNSRYGLDCNLMLGASTVFLYYFFKAIQSGEIRWYLISGFCAGIVLYSYIISYLIVPFFLLFSVIYLLWVRKVNWSRIFAFGVPFLFLAFPLLLVQMVNIFGWEDIRIGIFTVNRLSNYRASEFTASDILPNLIKTIKCLLRDGELIFDAFPQYGTFYLISIPFLGIGGIVLLWKAIVSVKRRCWDHSVLLLIWILLFIILGCFLGGDGPLTYRFNAAFLVLLLILSEGILTTVKLAGKYANWLLGAVIVVYGICFVSFFRYYFYIYPDSVYPQYGFQPELFQVVEYNEGHREELEKYQIYLCLNYSAAEYYGLAAQILPTEYYVNNQRDSSRCENVIFISDSKREVDEGGCYIVWETYDGFLNYLKENGFDEKQKVGRYVYMAR